jgi:glycosyltransferase 2 family protein
VRPGAWTAIRLTGGLLIIGALLWRLGAGPFLDGLRAIGPGTLLAAVAIGAATTACAAWRWRVVAGALGIGLPLRGATAAYYRSQFLNSALPGGVLGDVHRGVRHGVDAGDLGRGVRSVVWERTAGQLVQAAVAVVVLLVLPSPVHSSMPVVALAVIGVAGVLLVSGRTLLRHGPGRLTRPLRLVAVEGRDALLGPTAWPAVLLASLLVVGGHLATFLLAASAVGLRGSVQEALPLGLVVLLAAAIPLNVGGWGPREGVAAWVFASAGWGATAGAATATAFGVLTLAAVLPGAVVLLADRRRPRRGGPHPRTDRPGAGVVSTEAREDGALHG